MKKRNGKLGQAAMEFMMSYGWAILVAVVAIGAFAFYVGLDKESFVTESCVMTAGFHCSDSKVDATTGEIKLTVRNSQGKDVEEFYVSGDSCEINSTSQDLDNGQETTLTLSNCNFGESVFSDTLVANYKLIGSSINHVSAVGLVAVVEGFSGGACNNDGTCDAGENCGNCVEDCAVPEICDDTLDNDCDGLIDCVDVVDCGSDNYCNYLDCVGAVCQAVPGSGGEADVCTNNADCGSVPGLLLWLRFEGDADDSSGNGFDGNLMNGATFDSDSKEGDMSLSLDGVDDYVDLPSIDVNNGVDEMTITAWAKKTGGVGDARIISKATGPQQIDHWWMLGYYQTNYVRFRLKTGSGTSTSMVFSDGAISASSWNHIAVVYDGSEMKIYLNGVQDTSVDPQTGDVAIDPNVDVYVGDNPGSMSRILGGNIDDLRIYERALSDQEIANLASG